MLHFPVGQSSPAKWFFKKENAMTVGTFIRKVGEILDRIPGGMKIVPPVGVSEIGIDEQGDVTGWLYCVEVTCDRLVLDYVTVLKAIACVLVEAGVGVYVGGMYSDIIVTAKRICPISGLWFEISLLYSRGNFFGAPERKGRASIFADGLGCGYKMVGERLFQVSKWNKRRSTGVFTEELIELEKFSMSKEEIIREGVERAKNRNS